MRLWSERDSGEESSWRGVAERVGTERQCKFQKLDELVNWMRKELSQPPTQFHDLAS